MSLHLYDANDYPDKRSGKDRRASMLPDEITKLIEVTIAKTQRTNCSEHSGMVVWLKIGCGLLAFASGVFSWSTFVVAPEIKLALDKQTAANDKRFYAIERDLTDLKLTDLRIIGQRNLDHSEKEKLQQ